MQNHFVREAFRWWLPNYIKSQRSPALAAASRVYASLIDPVIGHVKCSAVDREDAMARIMRLASEQESAAGAYANNLLCLMMETFKLWPRSSIPFEPFSARSPIDIPLSPLEVADLVCKMPVAYRVMIHMILLTGIKPQQLALMGKMEFQAMLGRLDGRQDKSIEMFEMPVPGSHTPVYLSLPVINRIRSQVAKLASDESRVFKTTAASINNTWARYAGDAPLLSRYKATAGTHLLRHGGDAHVLSANLGINLSSAEMMVDRLSPLVQHGELLMA